MTKRPKQIERDPPWMRLGPASDAPDEGDDGERLWKKIAQGVRPLEETKHKKHAKPLPSPLEGAVPRRSFGGGGKSAQGAGGADPLRPAERTQGVRRAGHLPLKGREGPPPLVPGELAGLDRRSGERLRKGQMAVEAKLDLHGMTQYEAHGAVARFIGAQHAAGKRCVLIVTGKGKAPFEAKAVPHRFTFASSRGVLKEALPRWLNEPGLRAHIIAVSPASRAHGGEGAVYVLLKRKR